MADPNLTYQGRPCKRGHSGVRYVVSGDCVECHKLRNHVANVTCPECKRLRAQLLDIQRQERHGGCRGNKRHPLYYTWYNIIQRCYRPSVKSYKDYGAKGIRVCDRWRYSFGTFLADILSEIGERPDGLTLDRIDSKGHYQPGNVRWATRTIQSRNRPGFVRLTPEIARCIRTLHAIGVKRKDIMQAFDIDNGIISQIATNKAWKE